MYWTSIREVLFPEHLSRTKKLLFLPSIYSFHSSSPATSHQTLSAENRGHCLAAPKRKQNPQRPDRVEETA